MSSGFKSKPVGESGFGSPAFGYADTNVPDFSASSARNGRIRSGPSEQFRPTDSGFKCFTAFQYASTFCAETSVSPPRPTAAEIITGSTTPSFS